MACARGAEIVECLPEDVGAVYLLAMITSHAVARAGADQKTTGPEVPDVLERAARETHVVGADT